MAKTNTAPAPRQADIPDGATVTIVDEVKSTINPPSGVPADPFAGIEVFAADAWAPPRPQLSPTLQAIADHLLSDDSHSVSFPTAGWKTGLQSKLCRDLKAWAEDRGDVKLRFTAGRIDDKAALKITLKYATPAATTVTDAPAVPGTE